MKQLFAIGAIALGIACSSPALAHEAPARHGGVVASAADLSFELVARDGKAVLYIADHGRALPTRGASASLTVLHAGTTVRSALAPAGQDMLVSQTALALPRGAKAVATVALPGREPVSVRFSFK